MATAISLRDRFLGGILGHALGDGLGAPFEGLTSELIYGTFGRPSDIVANPPVDTLHCTDDTHMAIAVAETLCAHGQIDTDALFRAFVAGYDPRRGYGPGTRRLIEAAQAGQDWRQVAASLFPGGSFGNGGAMRVAPVGLFFHHDLDRAWAEAGRSASITHGHPLGVQGAQLLALAVALAARGEAGDRTHLYQVLFDRATEDEYRWLLSTAYKLAPQDSLALLGGSMEAHRSVVTAIACFAASPDSYAGAVARALALGDDTDTLMAMAGAISGAHLGAAALPPHLLARLENGARGRAYVEGLAGRLYERFLGSTQGEGTASAGEVDA